MSKISFISYCSPGCFFKVPGYLSIKRAVDIAFFYL